MSLTGSTILKESPHLTWLKGRPTVECNLAGSGVPPCTLAELGGVEADAPLTEHTDYGWPPLLAAIAARYGVSDASVVVTAGASMANHLTMATLLSPGDHVVVEQPGYDPLAHVARLWGAALTFVLRRAEEGYRIDVEAIGACLTPATRLVVLSNLHNPSGALARDADLAALAELAEARGFHVLVDEVYREWVHGRGGRDTVPESAPHAGGDAMADGARSVALISPRMVATSSLTKAFGLNGLRIGWVLAHAPLADRIRRLMGLFDNISAHPSERLATRALERAEAILAPRRALVTANRARVAAWVAATPSARWVEPAAGAVAWIDLGARSTTRLADRLARDYGTLVVPGGLFGGSGHIRVALGVEPSVLDRGLGRITAGLAQPGCP
jgi:aspartate/methionine/tyrosine aminotransferase